MRWRAVVVAVLAVTAGCSGVSGLFGEGTPERTETVTPVPVPTVTERSTPRLPLPPGLARSGIDNPVIVADAHADRLANVSYTWHERYVETVRSPNETRTVRRSETVWVRDATRYRHDFNRTITHENGTMGYRQSTYSAGDWWAERRSTEDGWVYANGTVGAESDPFAGTAEFLLRRFLRVRNATTSLVVHENERRFRVAGNSSYLTTLPDGDAYRVVAIVDRNGLVHRLDVTYAVQFRDTVKRVEYSFRYERIGTTTVPTPSWVNRTGAGGG